MFRLSLSLKTIISLVVALIVLVVGAACLSVSLSFAIASITAVGEAWAQDIAGTIGSAVRANYFKLHQEQKQFASGRGKG